MKYTVLRKGKSLKEFKMQFAHLINEASKTTQLCLFNFRASLNICGGCGVEPQDCCQPIPCRLYCHACLGAAHLPLSCPQCHWGIL